MRNKIFYCCLFAALAILLVGYLQYGRDVTVCSSNLTNFSDGNTEDITIMANKLYIFDKEKFAEHLLQRCVNNSFKEVRFSYDLNGYPNEVQISVYVNRMLWKLKKKAFEIHYISDGLFDYNIADNPEMFRVEIKSAH